MLPLKDEYRWQKKEESYDTPPRKFVTVAPCKGDFFVNVAIVTVAPENVPPCSCGPERIRTFIVRTGILYSIH